LSRRTTQLIKAALATLYYSGADGLAAPLTRAEGVIFMLHRVTREPVAEFEPNRILKITPEFLESVIRHVMEAGFEFLALDEIPERLRSPRPGRPFACFTFDDGYRDNLTCALPIFRRFGIPLTVYVPTDYVDGRGDLWWLMLERVIARAERIEVAFETVRAYETASVQAKDAAFHDIYWRLREMPELEARAIVNGLAAAHGLDHEALCSEMILSWDELRALAADPLVTVGAHTCRHLALAKLDEKTARAEMVDSIARIEQELGKPCRHFSFPYGCDATAGPREFALASELGMLTAVTTGKGLIQRGHSDHLTALPRFSLNGDYQDIRYVKVMLSGLPFALWNAVTWVRPSTAT